MSLSSSWKPSFRRPRIFSDRLIFAGVKTCMVPFNLFCHSERSRGISYYSAKNIERCLDFAGHDKYGPAMTKAAENIIVALDVPAKKEALELVEKLDGQISFFKIGLQLYTAEGPEIMRAVSSTGSRVFLDLKLHDIPNTVARTVESAGRLGVQMLTIHLSGGSEMIRAATAARTNNMLLLGVTFLTSSTEETLSEIGIASGVADQVLRLAKLGVDAGIDGVVASPHE